MQRSGVSCFTQGVFFSTFRSLPFGLIATTARMILSFFTSSGLIEGSTQIGTCSAFLVAPNRHGTNACANGLSRHDLGVAKRRI
jgi:hypothetical protein